MKIYNYHPYTNEYVGDSVADESPLEPGVYHIPAFATLVEPLDPKENHAIVFNVEANEWTYIELPPLLTESQEQIESAKEVEDPLEKLKLFLASNPDVAELLK